MYHVTFKKDTPNEDGKYEVKEWCFCQMSHHIMSPSQITKFISSNKKYCQNRVLDLVNMGSGWVQKEILVVDLEIGRCLPLNGSSPLLGIDSLCQLKRSHHFFDNDCFLRCIAYHFIRSENLKEQHKFISEHVFWTLPLLFQVHQVPSFEKQNHHLNLHINILYTDGKEIFPLHMSSSRGDEV